MTIFLSLCKKIWNNHLRRKQGSCPALSFSAHLKHCNVATCWHIELSVLSFLRLAFTRAIDLILRPKMSRNSSAWYHIVNRCKKLKVNTVPWQDFSWLWSSTTAGIFRADLQTINFWFGIMKSKDSITMIVVDKCLPFSIIPEWLGRKNHLRGGNLKEGHWSANWGGWGPAMSEHKSVRGPH